MHNIRTEELHGLDGATKLSNQVRGVNWGGNV